MLHPCSFLSNHKSTAGPGQFSALKSPEVTRLTGLVAGTLVCSMSSMPGSYGLQCRPQEAVGGFGLSDCCPLHGALGLQLGASSLAITGPVE